MRVIYKFLLNRIGTEQQIEVGTNSLIVNAGVQADRYCVWVEHEKYEVSSSVLTLRVFATGEEIPIGWWHRVTFFEGPNSELVWHLYQKF